MKLDSKNEFKGTVTWFDTAKGYGFIKPEDGGKDVFVHISSVEKSGLTNLLKNQKIEYELCVGRDGRESAYNIKLLKSSSNKKQSTPVSVGFVRWFGGFNRNTWTKNNYGFINTIEGEDLYLNGNKLDGIVPYEDEFVIFEIKDDKAKVKKTATKVEVLKAVEDFPTDRFIKLLHDETEFEKIIGSEKYKNVLDILVNDNNNDWALKFLSEMFSQSSSARFVAGEMIKDRELQVQLFDELNIEDIVTADKTCEFVPSHYFDKRHFKWIELLKNKSQSERQIFFENKIDSLSTSFIFVCCFEEVIDESYDLGVHSERISNFVKKMFEMKFSNNKDIGGVVGLKDYVWDLYQKKFNDFDGFSRCPVISSYCGVVNLFESLKKKEHQVQFLDRLGIFGIIDADKTCEFVPSHYFDKRHAEWIKWLKNCSRSEKQIFFENKIDSLSTSFILVCCFEEVIDESFDLGVHSQRVTEFVKIVFQTESIKIENLIAFGLQNYVLDIYMKKFSNFNDLSRCSAISEYCSIVNLFKMLKGKDQQTQFLDNLGIPGIMDADKTYVFVPMHYFNERQDQWIQWLTEQTKNVRKIFFWRKIQNLSTDFILASVFNDLIQDIELWSHRISKSCFDKQQKQWFQWLKNKSQSERQEFFENKINNLSFSFVLACIFEGLIQNFKLLNSHSDLVLKFIKYVYEYELEHDYELKKKFISPLDYITNEIMHGHKKIEEINIENYVTDIYKHRVKNFGNFSSCPALVPFFELSKIKRKAFLKDCSFVDDINHLENSCSDPETFILYKLLPLICNEDSDEISNIPIEDIFFHHIWKAILDKKLSINDHGLFKLFPSCKTLGHVLSCEATFWKKGNIFYCRNEVCNDPKTIPDTNKLYLDFNIYDWLEYFGKSYKNKNQPSYHDFPIKISGFLNRLKEIRKRLDCRTCGSLMKPNLEYSRHEIYVYDKETKKFFTEQLIAAYKVTVFYCTDRKCSEYNKGCYISHCLGGKYVETKNGRKRWDKCKKIIDSRDLSRKCDNNRYICDDCGGCCKKCNT